MNDDKRKVPAIIAAFNCHGMNLVEPVGASSNWQGDCVFCGKEARTYADPETGKWDCKVCGQSGNLITFLTRVVAHWHKKTTRDQWLKLSASRRIPTGILKARNLGFDGEQWLVPAHSHSGHVHDLRRYDWEKTMSTAGCKSQLFGMEHLAKAKPGTRVWLCEGEWDALAMDWLKREMGEAMDKDVVVAVPGAATLKPEWIPFFQGKDVVAVYDADDAGESGAAKAHRMIKGAKKLTFINWPDSRPNGYDLRDFVTGLLGEASPQDVFDQLMALRSDKPRGMRAKEEAAVAEKESAREAIDPITFDELVQIFGQQVMVSQDFVDGLRVAAAVALSNDIPGDPLWTYIVGPPGAGKTLILSSFGGSERCLFRSTVTPHSLVSGWRGDGINDPSLIPQLKGLTLVAKDFTEILTMPTMIQEEIFSTLRGAYDGTVQKQFGNGVMREYTDCYFSILAGVTHAIHGNSRATLGERFLKFQFQPTTKEHTTELIMMAINNVGRERQVEDKLKGAMRRYLANKIPIDDYPLMSPEYSERLLSLVQLIAALRAQVERDVRTQEVTHRPTQEYGTRLAKQLAKLGMAIAFTYGKKVVDAEVWRLIERVAYDTAYGFNSDIINSIMSLGNAATKREVAANAKIPHTTLSRRFDDMTLMGMIEPHPTVTRRPEKQGGNVPAVFRVTDKLAELWHKSKGNEWTPPQHRSEAPSTSSSSSTVRLVRRARVGSGAVRR